MAEDGWLQRLGQVKECNDDESDFRNVPFKFLGACDFHGPRRADKNTDKWPAVYSV